MSIPDFLTDVLESALDQGIGTPSDVLRHATPEELSKHLPRVVWKQLITAALSASRTDARLVVDTVTIATICKHLPSTIVWNCVAELGNRSLSKPLVAPPPGRASTQTGAPEPRPPATAAGSGPVGPTPGKKPPPGKPKRRTDEDDIEIDVADERKAPEGLPVDVDDEQLIDWAQNEELAAAAEAEASEVRRAPTHRS
ncbi:MAG TPA: hypothetical protein VHE35_23485 [Kofleriaceae bacterium]|nr:hypothetical protein [Kofleriaceae bacterium]